MLLASPALTQEAPAHRSVGTPGRGHLVGGVALPLRGRYHRIIPVTRERGYRYGTPELVSLLKRVARRVGQQHPGTLLQIANLSRQAGGNIPQSVTHNSGRDVDLLFFAHNEAQEPQTVTEFVHYDRQGKAGELRFDVARNWTLVRALIEDRRAQVQSILVSNGLRALLLAQARRIGVSPRLLEKAEAILRQPARAAPHNDHFHVRIYCAEHERLWGCINRGPKHPWANTYDAEADALGASLAEEFNAPDTETAVTAIQRAVLLNSPVVVASLRPALNESRHPVRSAALDAIEQLGATGSALPILIHAADRSTAGPWQTRLIQLLSRRELPEAQGVFLAALMDSDRAPETRMAAAKGLARLGSEEAVLPLIEVLPTPHEALRASAEQALERITNHRLGADAAGYQAWKSWWDNRREEGRTMWLQRGFEEHLSVPIESTSCVRAIRALLPLIRRSGVERRNAQDLIGALTGYAPRGTRRLHRRYRRWYRRGGARVCRERLAALNSETETINAQ